MVSTMVSKWRKMDFATISTTQSGENPKTGPSALAMRGAPVARLALPADGGFSAVEPHVHELHEGGQELLWLRLFGEDPWKKINKHGPVVINSV